MTRSILALIHMWVQENFTNKLSYRWSKKQTQKSTWKYLEVLSDTSWKHEKGETLRIHIQKEYSETYSHSFSIGQKNIPQYGGTWCICVQPPEYSHSRYRSNFSCLPVDFCNSFCVTRRVCTDYFLQDSSILHRTVPSSISFPQGALGKETMPSTASHQVKTCWQS